MPLGMIRERKFPAKNPYTCYSDDVTQSHESKINREDKLSLAIKKGMLRPPNFILSADRVPFLATILSI